MTFDWSIPDEGTGDAPRSWGEKATCAFSPAAGGGGGITSKASMIAGAGEVPLDATTSSESGGERATTHPMTLAERVAETVRAAAAS